MLPADPESFDLRRFEQLVAEARAATPAAASAMFREALALWRGPPLAEFAYEPWAQLAITRLEELRLEALRSESTPTSHSGSRWAGRASSNRSSPQHPLRERLRGQLMLALYRSGRQADALTAYRDARRTLVETLGIEPRAALRELERAILDQDPALDVASAESDAARARAATRACTSARRRSSAAAAS